MARRSFLKFLPAAVASAPVAAQEAAAKMGLQPLIGGASSLGGYANGLGNVPQPCSSHIDWLKERLKQLADPEYLAEMRNDMKWQVTRLDADLAAMRGLSPGAAMSIQIDRQIKRNLARETWSIRKQIKEATGF